jgi:GNAT superfamily N-acetyltransferase
MWETDRGTPPAGPSPERLRAAAAADADPIADVLLAARRTFLAYAPLAHSEPDVRGWVRDRLVAGGGVTVAVDGGAVVGFIAVADRGDARWIDQMYVDPARVGGGIGTRLLAHALATLAPPIRLWTFQANAGARRFYERHGFRALRFTDGAANEERCPDALYERSLPGVGGC